MHKFDYVGMLCVNCEAGMYVILVTNTRLVNAKFEPSSKIMRIFNTDLEFHDKTLRSIDGC